MGTRWRELALVALVSVGCDPGGNGDASALDGSVLDAAALDAPSDDATELDVTDVGLDAPELDALELDAPVADGGCVCFSEDFCIAVTGCDLSCTYAPRPDGTACPAGVCRMGVCTAVPPGCGDGVRTLTPMREGCDDGNLDDGDACSPGCAPSLLVVSSPVGEAASEVTMAIDGGGRVLFSWLESRAPASPSTERTLIVRGAIYSGAGVLLAPAFTVDAGTGGVGFGVGQAITPRAAGLADGWAVAWRSTFIEGTDADLGGIAYRTVRLSDGATIPTLGSVLQANREERFDQRDPAITAVGTGFVIAWTDGSDRAADPGRGVRARRFNPSPGPEMTVATVVSGDQLQPALAGTGTTWSVAFTDMSSGTPLVRLRRYDGVTPLDPEAGVVSSGWASSPHVSHAASTTWAVWHDRASDPMGNGEGVALLDAAPTGSADFILGDDGEVEDGFVVAGHSAIAATVGYRTDISPQGLSVVPLGWSLPPEGPVLQELLVGHRQRDLVLLTTPRGLWLAWTDESLPAATSSVVAYLLPWD